MIVGVRRSLICVLLLTFVASAASALDQRRLELAIESDDVAYVRRVINSGQATVNERIPGLSFSKPVVPLVVIAGANAAMETLSFLVSRGADLEAATPVAETALMWAAIFAEPGDRESELRNLRAVDFLVRSGARLEPAGSNYTPLGYAAVRGFAEIMQYLLRAGSRVDATAVGDRSPVPTPLILSAMEGTDRAALLLLRAGANARVVTDRGLTARLVAERNNRRALANYLRCAERLAPGEDFRRKCE